MQCFEAAGIADWDRPTAQEKISPLLTSGIDFDCILSNNDSMALGAIEACNDSGIEIDFPIVGIDCTADGAQAVADGRMAMTLFQDPVGQGKGALMAALNMLEGKPINDGTGYELDSSGESYSDSIIWVPFEPVTKDNVADYMK
ncbi:substrate-binding domain-containing protein [Butyricicoccus sp.]|uniref:substrate-binding domain-containing protein n=1 Tax=Butyricicoccus sp. TaxID=2049021 RepID=UPI003735131D